MSKIYLDNIEEATLENTYWRKVVFTGKYAQLVLMSIPVGQEIDMEIHPHTDQFFRFEQGQGEIIIFQSSNCESDKSTVYQVKDGTGVVVPSGTYHRVRNIGQTPLKLYSIYSPPHHPKELQQALKPVKTSSISQNALLLLSVL